MNALRYLITADPVSKLQPKYDTSLRLAAELLKRQIAVDYCNLSEANAAQDSTAYLATLPVRQIRFSDPAALPFIGFEEARTRPIADYAVVLHRKDPPVDDFYRSHAKHFEQAPKSILQINDPHSSVAFSEHELPLRYADRSIPTTTCATFAEFLKAVRAEKTEAVAKPLNECSGNGVYFFKPDESESTLRSYWDRWQPAIVQPYLDEITKSGDLRILIFNEKILGSVLRVPKSGSRLANLHQGATGRAFTPTPYQLETSRQVAKDLKPFGLYLLGLDFIGEPLSEVNITSPSALAQINEVSGLDLAPVLIDEIEKLRHERKG